MRTTIRLSLSILTLSFLTSCMGQGINPNSKEDHKYSVSLKQKISISEAKEIQKNNSEVIFIDVRTPEEVSEGSIDGSMKINWSSPDFKEKVEKLDKSKKYIVYCAAGVRSGKAQSLMQSLGFANVLNLAGGYEAFKKQ